jgi:hypothetical protein
VLNKVKVGCLYNLHYVWCPKTMVSACVELLDLDLAEDRPVDTRTVKDINC